MTALKIWTTQFYDEVTVGDEVALGLIGHPDARGLIVRAAEDGRPVVACSHCTSTVAVEDFNLSMLIAKGGDNSRVC
jgi:hypothetical protein